MGKVTGFMEYERQKDVYLDVDSRIKNYGEFVIPMADEKATIQLHVAWIVERLSVFRCPINNIIPDWNDLVYKGKLSPGLDVLHSPIFSGIYRSHFVRLHEAGLHLECESRCSR